MTREEIKKHYLEIDKLFTTEFSISKYHNFFDGNFFIQKKCCIFATFN